MSYPNPTHALASNLIHQTLSSINLLESLSLLSSSDARLIRLKLPSSNGPFPSLNPPTPNDLQQMNQTPPSSQLTQRSDLSTSFDNLSVSGPGGGGGPSSSQSYGYQAPPNLPPRSRPLPSGPQESRAKGLWDYHGSEPDDLAFRAGDIIIIDEEVNEQWYRGRVIPQGQNYPLERSGLFPSNYVEKLAPNQNQAQGQGQYPPPSPAGPQAMVSYSGPPSGHGPQYQQYGGGGDPSAVPYGQVVKSDYNGQMVGMPPPQQNTMMAAPPPGSQQQPRPNPLGKIGSKLGNAAVQGAGWGFGATVGGELAHAIF